MPRSGSDIYRLLQQTLDQSRTAAIGQKREVDRLDGQLNDLVADKGAALLDLAKHYLPEMTRPAIEATFDGIRGSLLEVLGRKERTQAELTARAQRFVETIRSLDERLGKVTAELNVCVQRRQELEREVADRLKTDAEFQTLSTAAAQMEARLQQSEARVNEMNATAGEKLPPYKRSALFQYLYRRGYGTEKYQARGMIKSLDKWVADMIDFPKAKIGFEFLMKMPNLMAEEFGRRKSEFKGLMEKIEAIEQRYQDSVGLTPVLAEGGRQGQIRDEIVKTLETTHREQRAVDTELQQLDQTQSRFYAEAIQRFQQFLSQTETGVLQTRAQRTPDPRDDQIVTRISNLTAQIEQMKSRIAQATPVRRQADEIASGLEMVVNRFRQNNFDSGRSRFDNTLDVSGELHRFQQGVTKPEELWQIIRRKQEFEPTVAESVASEGAQVALHVLTHPAVSQALVQASAQVVGTALSSFAQSGIERRAPERQASEQQQGRPSSGAYFTTGDGF